MSDTPADSQQKQAVMFGMFEMPTTITLDKEKSSGNVARFVAEPFERGFGHTIGNSMRRMLLTALEAPAIIAVRIEGVPHEYTAVEGILEDMTNVILNFKGALLRRIPYSDERLAREGRTLTNVLEITQADLDANGGKVAVTLGDIIDDPSYEVINPDHYLFTVTAPATRQVDVRVAIGRGYVPSERHIVNDKSVDEIIMDSSFSPVTLVNYWVENTRVGQDTDYDRLVIDVTTDGRLTPSEALTFGANILTKHLTVFSNVEDLDVVFDEDSDTFGSEHDSIMEKLSLRIDEIELSVRSTNCLSGANIETIAELVTIPERKMLEFRNFGKKSLNEIKAKLNEMGLGLGMDLSRYGLTHENVKEKIKEFNEEPGGVL